jgi:hypothetical protein
MPSYRWGSIYRTRSSVFGPELDDGIGRFGLVRRQAGQIRVAPVGQIDNASGLDCCLRRVGRLHDVETIAVKEERVIPEQVAELRRDRDWDRDRRRDRDATEGVARSAALEVASARAASRSARVAVPHGDDDVERGGRMITRRERICDELATIPNLRHPR